jgi:hypothetical protein
MLSPLSPASSSSTFHFTVAANHSIIGLATSLTEVLMSVYYLGFRFQTLTKNSVMYNLEIKQAQIRY